MPLSSIESSVTFTETFELLSVGSLRRAVWMSLRIWSEAPEAAAPVEDCEPVLLLMEPVELLWLAALPVWSGVAVELGDVDDCAPVVLDRESGVATLPLCGVVLLEEEAVPGVDLVVSVLDWADCEPMVALAELLV